ncbi:MAG: hypothetical protein ACKO54_04950 [Alphaproteobacteria bacterium]
MASALRIPFVLHAGAGTKARTRMLRAQRLTAGERFLSAARCSARRRSCVSSSKRLFTRFSAEAKICLRRVALPASAFAAARASPLPRFPDQVAQLGMFGAQPGRDGAKFLRRQGGDGRLMGRRNQGEGIVAQKVAFFALRNRDDV